MKKIIFTALVLISCLTFKNANAQISFNLNIGSQPEWGPVGYDHADYYYMPDIDSYYDVPAHQYIYYENNVWVHRASLPVRYRNYNVYNGYKVVVNERNPWVRNNVYRARYANYKGRTGQTLIRDSREDKYRNHWQGDNRGGRGNNNHVRGRNNSHDNRGGRGNDHREDGHNRH